MLRYVGLATSILKNYCWFNMFQDQVYLKLVHFVYTTNTKLSMVLTDLRKNARGKPIVWKLHEKISWLFLVS